MNMDKMMRFLKYSTIVNLVFISILALCLYFSDALFNIQKPWFKGNQDTFALFLYGFVGFYKLIWIFFNLFPYLILRKIK